IWSAATGQEVHTFKDHRGTVSGVAFSPDGKRLASAGEDGTVVMRDVTTDREIFRLRVPAPARTVVFSADGRRLATVSGDKTVTVWDAARGEKIFTQDGPGDIIPSVAFSPDGHWLATADAAGDLLLWDATTGRLIHTLHAQDSSPASTVLRIASQDQESRP